MESTIAGQARAYSADAAYPFAWEADVVLRDGRTARLRPIRPDDGPSLRGFHARLSDQTIYYRFFAPHPTLSEEEVHSFTHVDYRDRVALIVVMRGDIVGVGRYDRIDDDRAEVAFVIRDDHQGLGLGSLLLEHLAAAARENGIHRFVAEVLPTNSRMLATFRYAGYQVAQGYDEGVVSLTLAIDPTDESDAVRDAREQRSEARSLVPLLRPRSVAVVGVSRREGTVGHALLRSLVTGGFSGMVYAVHPHAKQILGVTCYPSLAAIAPVSGSGPELVVIAVGAPEVPALIDEAGQAGARAIVVVSSGFESTEDGRIPQPSRLARHARDGGMRLLGPAALGVVNTEDDVSLNASLLPDMPRSGRIGFFSQSGALAVDIMRRMDARALGVSFFVSAGHRADVSGNDLLQFWEEDERTQAIMMYLETVGNPRKFARLAERITRHKPVVVLRTTGARRAASASPALESLDGDDVPDAAFDQIVADSGVIEVASIDHMLDVAEVLQIRGSLGRGRIGIVGNSEAVEILASNAAQQHGLVREAQSRILSRTTSPHRFRRYLDDTVRDPCVDIVVALYVPPVESSDDAQVGALIAELAATVSKPIIAVVLGWNAQALRQATRVRPGVVLPIFTDVEHAMAALSRVVAYASTIAAGDDTRDRAAPMPGCDALAARSLIAQYADGSSASSAEDDVAGFDNDLIGPLLSSYGLPPLREAADPLTERAVRIIGTRDRLLGPVVSFGLASEIAEQLGDRHYALAPLTAHRARQLVQRSAVSMIPIDAGDRAGLVDQGAVSELTEFLRRIAALLDDVPRIRRIEVTVEPHRGWTDWGTRHAAVRIARHSGERLWGARSLTRLAGPDPH